MEAVRGRAPGSCQRRPDNSKLTDGRLHELTRTMEVITRKKKIFKVICGGKRREHGAAAFHCKTLNAIGHFKRGKHFLEACESAW